MHLYGLVYFWYQHDTFNSKIWKKGTPAIVTTPTIRAVSHTFLGAISAMGVVNIEFRLPNSKPKGIKADGSRKRKQPQPKKSMSKGISPVITCYSFKRQWTVWTSTPRWRDFALSWAMPQYTPMMTLTKWFQREDTKHLPSSIFIWAKFNQELLVYNEILR